MSEDGESVPWRNMAHDVTCQTAGKTAECPRCVLKRKAKQRRRSLYRRHAYHARRLRTALERLVAVWDGYKPIHSKTAPPRTARETNDQRLLHEFRLGGTTGLKPIVSVVLRVDVVVEEREMPGTSGQVVRLVPQRRDTVRSSIHGRSYGSCEEGSTKIVLNAYGRRQLRRHPVPLVDPKPMIAKTDASLTTGGEHWMAQKRPMAVAREPDLSGMYLGYHIPPALLDFPDKLENWKALMRYRGPYVAPPAEPVVESAPVLDPADRKAAFRARQAAARAARGE